MEGEPSRRSPTPSEPYTIASMTPRSSLMSPTPLLDVLSSTISKDVIDEEVQQQSTPRMDTGHAVSAQQSTISKDIARQGMDAQIRQDRLQISSRRTGKRPLAALCRRNITEFDKLKPSSDTRLFRPNWLSQTFSGNKPEARPVCPHGELDFELRSILVEGTDTQEQRVQHLCQYLKGHDELRLRETGWIGFRPRSPGSNATAFARTGLGLQEASVLAKALGTLECTIADLDLTDNSFGPNEVSLLAKAMASNRSLTAVRMSGNRASVFGAAEVALTLSLNSRIQELELARASLGRHGAECLAKYLGPCHLSALDLSDNSMGDKGVAGIVQSLSSNFTLQRLELGGNGMTDEGAAAVAGLLKSLSKRSPTEKQLGYLGLQRNKIGAKGASEISNALTLGCGLQTLDLRANFIRDEGALALIEAVKTKNHNLNRLDIDGSGTSASLLAALTEALELSKTIGEFGKIELKLWKGGAVAGLEPQSSGRFSSRDGASNSKQSGRSEGSLPTRTLVAEILGRPPCNKAFGATKRVAPGGMLL